MKILALASLLATVIICPPADARSMQPSLQETLRTVEINGEKTGYVAQLNLDFLKSEMKVTIYKDICGHFAPAVPGMMRCMAMPVAVTTLEAPLLSREMSCGSAYYKGEKDETPFDGLKTTIVAVDHSRRICHDIQPSAVSVTAETLNPWTNTVTKYEFSK